MQDSKANAEKKVTKINRAKNISNACSNIEKASDSGYGNSFLFIYFDKHKGPGEAQLHKGWGNTGNEQRTNLVQYDNDVRSMLNN